MNKVMIITDSTCDLPDFIIKEKNIKVVPLYVNFGLESYKDGETITTDELYKLVEEKKETPKTSAISVGDFYTVFKPYIDEGYDIFYTGISGKMSTTLNNAVLVSKEFPEGRIYTSDSMNLSTGIGLLVLKAAKFRDQGLSVKEIKEKIDEIVPNVRAEFAICTMEYLHKGGRCSSLQKIFGTFLKIKPIIRVSNGSMVVAKKPRGNMLRALNEMLEDIKADVENLDLDCVMVTHSYADSDAVYLKEELGKLNIPVILETKAGCVISSHCGKRTIGILYIVK